MFNVWHQRDKFSITFQRCSTPAPLHLPLAAPLQSVRRQGAVSLSFPSGRGKQLSLWKEVLPGLIRRHPLAISSWVNWVYTITISRSRVIPLLFTFQSLAKSVLEEGGWSSLIVSISLVLTLNPEASRGTRARGRMERSEAPNLGWGMAMERGDGRRKMNRWWGYFCLDIFINTSKG